VAQVEVSFTKVAPAKAGLRATQSSAFCAEAAFCVDAAETVQPRDTANAAAPAMHIQQ
jgi:hypothetical protein